jgi:hypothetical protein
MDRVEVVDGAIVIEATVAPIAALIALAGIPEAVVDSPVIATLGAQ